MTTVPDYRFDQPANVQSVTPAMYRARALAFLAAQTVLLDVLRAAVGRVS